MEDEFIMGIDPGKDGAFVVMNPQYEIIDRCIMPTIGDKREYDKAEMVRIFTKYKLKHVVIEKPVNLWGYAKSAVESLSHNVGLLEGMAMALGLSHSMIKPQQWQPVAWADTPRQYKAKNEKGRKMSDPKSTSTLAAINFYPQVDWRKNDRCKNRHDGLIDAALIARYGVNTFFRKASKN